MLIILLFWFLTLETIKADCSNDKKKSCLNGSKCVSFIDKYHVKVSYCKCKNGFDGDRCENDCITIYFSLI